MIYYSITEARKNLKDILNKVRYQKVIIAIGRRGKGEVMVVPAPELEEDIPVTAMNSTSGSFDFLHDEPDIYTLKDLKKRHV